jgi:GDP-4-dehydro-6-deoxy-D-mannose reductase
VKVETERLRRADVPAQIGNPARLRQVTGWEPRIPLEQTLRDLLNDWRRRLASPVAPAFNR